MSPLKNLPICGKFIGRGIKVSTVIHIILLFLLILLSTYSQQRIDELTLEKEQQTKDEKKEKIENAIAEQQLKQDIKEVLEELNPEASAEELKELQEALEEKIDKEKLKEQLIAAMDKSPEEQEENKSEENTEENAEEKTEERNEESSEEANKPNEDNNDYLNTLQEELAKNLDEATQAANDKLLEDQLLEDLVYQDLPEIDNNIENALKRDSFKELSDQALKDQANKLAESTKSLIAQLKEPKSNTNIDQIKKQIDEKQKDLHEQSNTSDDSINAATDLTKLSEKTLEQAQEISNKEIGQETNAQKSLKSMEETFKDAKEAEAKAKEQFKEIAKESINDIKSQSTDDKTPNSQKNKLEHLARGAQSAVNNKNVKSQDAVKKIAALKNHSNTHVAKNAEQKKQNEKSVNKANEAMKKHVQAKDKLANAQTAMLKQAAATHREELSKASQLLKRFERNKDLKESAASLKKAINDQRRHSKPRNQEQFNRTKEAIKSLAQAQKKFNQDLNTLRKETADNIKQQISDLNALKKDIANINDINSQQTTNEIIEAVKDALTQERIDEKAATLAEALENSSKDEKNSRTEDFKQRAANAVSNSKQSQDNKSSSESEESKETQNTKIGMALKEALAQKVSDVGGSADTEGENDKPESQATAQSNGLRGIEVDSKKGIESITSKWRFRKLSIEEKQKILLKNNVSTTIQEPPQLRFARPTLEATPDNNNDQSAEIFVGEMKKRDIATLDPNRPRTPHSKYKDSDLAAVPYCFNIPTLDGDSSDWNLERTRLSKGKDVFMQWRPDGLYVLALVRDKSGTFEKSDIYSMKTRFWDFDTMELWFDMKNSKAKKTDLHACQQFWACPDLPGIDRSHELWEVIWNKGTKTRLHSGNDKPYIGSKVHDDKKGYNLELFIPRALLTNLNYFRAGQVIGFLYIINSSHNPNHMQSSLKEFNPNFHYSSKPASWGNLQLLGTDAALNTLTADGKPTEYPFVEVSKPLGLMVNDHDSNTDTGAVNSITVRVKNQNGFDGRKTNEQGQELGDWEDVRLIETGKNTGVFKGWAPTTSLPSSTGDQKIGVQPGDTLDVYYNDYVRMAGEYDEKLHVQVTVVSPIITSTGANTPQPKP